MVGLASRGFLVPLREFAASVGVDPDLAQSYAWRALYVAALLLVLQHGWWRLPAFATSGYVAAIAVGSSAVWSIDPARTLDRSTAFAGTIVVAIFIGGVGRLTKTLRWGLVPGLAASLLVGLAGMGADPLHPGTWRGVYPGKQDLGAAAGMLCCLAIARLRRQGTERHTLVDTSQLLLGGVLLLASQNMTHVVAFLACLLVGAGWRNRGRLRVGIFLALVCVVLAGYTWLVFPAIFQRGVSAAEAISGKDPSLSGRTHLWAATGRAIAERPLLGYGYEAVFTEEPNPVAVKIRDRGGFQAAHSHNGYLQAALDLGLLGLMVLAWAITTALRNTFRDDTDDRVELRLLLAFVLVASLVEIGLTVVNGLVTVVLFSIISGYAQKSVAVPALPMPHRSTEPQLNR